MIKLLKIALGTAAVVATAMLVSKKVHEYTDKSMDTKTTAEDDSVEVHMPKVKVAAYVVNKLLWAVVLKPIYLTRMWIDIVVSAYKYLVKVMEGSINIYFTLAFMTAMIAFNCILGFTILMTSSILAIILGLYLVTIVSTRFDLSISEIA